LAKLAFEDEEERKQDRMLGGSLQSPASDSFIEALPTANP
jgi:hypothetical protein